MTQGNKKERATAAARFYYLLFVLIVATAAATAPNASPATAAALAALSPKNETVPKTGQQHERNTAAPPGRSPRNEKCTLYIVGDPSGAGENLHFIYASVTLYRRGATLYI